METYPERQNAFWHKDKSSRRSADHPIVAWIYGKQARKLKSLIPVPIHSIADCGCGNGFFQFHLELEFGAPCIGIDFSTEMLRINPCANKICASAMTLPFPDRSFDLVTCSMLLHHLAFPDRRRVIGEMSRIAKHCVLIAEPARTNIANLVFALSRREEHGSLNMGTRYLRKLCNQSGLEVLNIYVDALLLPNATPLWLFPLMRKLDDTRLSSWFGFTQNILCRPRRVSTRSWAHRR